MRALCDAGNDLSSSMPDDEAHDFFSFFSAITSDEDAERVTGRHDLSFAIFSRSLRRIRRADAWQLLIVIVLNDFASTRTSNTSSILNALLNNRFRIVVKRLGCLMFGSSTE